LQDKGGRDLHRSRANLGDRHALAVDSCRIGDGPIRIGELTGSANGTTRCFCEERTGSKQTAASIRGVIENVTLEEALTAFQLPRTLGQTADGKDIKANIGRFGPYIQIDKLFVSIKPLDPYDITLDQALELYAAKLVAEAEKNIADFGDGIKVLNGRFGPYISDGKKNAKIPKDTDPKTITHEEAKKMLAEAPAAGKKRFTKRKK